MSLADRITSPLNAASNSFTPSKETTSWADEVASPTGEAPPSLASAQVDGATEPQGGSGLQDSQFEVEVKLSELQANTSSPLYSISTFEELGLYVLLTFCYI